MNINNEAKEEEGSSGPKFDPPAYVQRYGAVADVLKAHYPKDSNITVVDFGCAGLKFFNYLKNLPQIQKVYAVDKDECLLESRKYMVSPLPYDYLSMGERTRPFTVTLLGGNVADPDSRLRGSHVVICIELIEHLEPNELEAFDANVFAYIKPEVVIITTPNADFNPLFPSLQGKMRHHDHKFEWTRQEFQRWCNGILKKHPSFTVEFSDIACHPDADPIQIGGCSQMAVFMAASETSSTDDQDTVMSYRTIVEYDYPMRHDIRTPFEHLVDEVVFHILSLARQKEEYFFGEPIEIPIQDLMTIPTIQDFIQEDEGQLREALQASGVCHVHQDFVVVKMRSRVSSLSSNSDESIEGDRVLHEDVELHDHYEEEPPWD